MHLQCGILAECVVTGSPPNSCEIGPWSTEHAWISKDISALYPNMLEIPRKSVDHPTYTLLRIAEIPRKCGDRPKCMLFGIIESPTSSYHEFLNRIQQAVSGTPPHGILQTPFPRPAKNTTDINLSSLHHFMSSIARQEATLVRFVHSTARAVPVFSSDGSSTEEFRSFVAQFEQTLRNIWGCFRLKLLLFFKVSF